VFGTFRTFTFLMRATQAIDFENEVQAGPESLHRFQLPAAGILSGRRCQTGRNSLDYGRGGEGIWTACLAQAAADGFSDILIGGRPSCHPLLHQPIRATSIREKHDRLPNTPCDVQSVCLQGG